MAPGQVPVPRQDDQIDVELAGGFTHRAGHVADAHFEPHQRRIGEHVPRNADHELALECFGLEDRAVGEGRERGRFDDMQNDQLRNRTIAETARTAGERMALSVSLDCDENATQRPIDGVGWHDDDRPVERLHEVEGDRTGERGFPRPVARSDDERDGIAFVSLGSQGRGDISLPHVDALDARPEQGGDPAGDLEHPSGDGRIVDGGEDGHDAALRFWCRIRVSPARMEAVARRRPGRPAPRTLRR